eukprot:TRINITY_DN2734_c0_g1_i2.p1 TRINITY_DN2734_c0_g1~~TRINITY_DN2734_c0_g1_i2.p1  ORF type:complete len:220 (-),score=18.73 TRINITY_DN2734_c0_g1_i2:710-1369(-)
MDLLSSQFCSKMASAHTLEESAVQTCPRCGRAIRHVAEHIERCSIEPQSRLAKKRQQKAKKLEAKKAKKIEPKKVVVENVQVPPPVVEKAASKPSPMGTITSQAQKVLNQMLRVVYKEAADLEANGIEIQETENLNCWFVHYSKFPRKAILRTASSITKSRRHGTIFAWRSHFRTITQPVPHLCVWCIHASFSTQDTLPLAAPFAMSTSQPLDGIARQR